VDLGKSTNKCDEGDKSDKGNESDKGDKGDEGEEGDKVMRLMRARSWEGKGGEESEKSEGDEGDKGDEGNKVTITKKKTMNLQTLNRLNTFYKHLLRLQPITNLHLAHTFGYKSHQKQGNQKR
jgi:hypothetical protein